MRQFFWGASTSSYQVEGGAITNNDWHYFTTNEIIKRRIFNLTTGSILYRDTKQISLGPAYDSAKFWDPTYYERDFNDATRMNMNAIRISLEWSRIQPERNQWNQDALEHYKKMIISMKEKHLNPVITLNHFTLPLWVLTPPTNFKKRLYQYLLPSPLRDLPLKEPPSDDSFWKSLRGWENPETIKAFTKFVKNIVLELKSYVDYWITLNEPIGSIVGGGYLSGLYPPGFFLDGNRAKKVLHNLVEAHVQTYNIISEVDDVDADNDGICKSVGISHLMVAVEPAHPKKLFGLKLMDNVQAAKNFAYFVNDYFLNAIVDGVEDLNYLNNLEIFNQESKQFLVNNDWKNRVDFIGVNYYRRVYVYHHPIIAISSSKFVGGTFANDLSKHFQQRHSLLNDLGWEIYPHGLYDFLVKIKKKWREEHTDKIYSSSKLFDELKNKSEYSKKNSSLDTKQLPNSWILTKLGYICELISGQHILEDNYNREGKGIPYITGPADFTKLYPIISKWTEKPKAISRKGDVLVTVKGAGVGKVNVLNIDNVSISRQLMAIRANFNPLFIFYYLYYNFHNLQKLGLGSTVPGIDRNSILNIDFLLPSSEEQEKIILDIENKFSIIDNNNQILKKSILYSYRLRQSIFQLAFNGKLVPQDQNDEPAEILLERIKRERESSISLKEYCHNHNN